MEVTETILVNCTSCQTIISNTAKYCPKCGKGVLAKKENTFDYDLRSFLRTCFLIIGYILGLHLLRIDGNTINNLIIDVCFLGIVLFIFFFDRNKVKETLFFKTFKLSRLTKYLGIQLLLSLAVIGFSVFLNSYLGKDKTNILDSYHDSFSPVIFATLSIAIFPAITEEIAFRAILFNSVLKLTTPVSTIFVTGIIFGFVHFSFLSILWLIPAGLFFGWIRYKEGIIWYGVCCHFLNNFIMVMIDYIYFHSGHQAG